MRNWSYEGLEREVRANLVYRDFTRVGAGEVPDAKTMGRWGLALGPQVLDANSGADRGDRQGRGCRGGTADACGYNGGGDQHPQSVRLDAAGRRGAGPDTHDQAGHHDCGDGGVPSCTTAAAA